MESVPELRIFGSDIDDSALHFARLARYPKGIAADVPPERLERFFESEDGTWCVRSQLREICLFAQHNVLRDPPFSRIDLISCRNVLIYMNAELQKRLMPVFHYALRRDGFLFLGPAENAGQNPKLFREVNRKHRIFRRIGETARLPEFPIAAGDGGSHGRPPVQARPTAGESVEAKVKEAARRLLERHVPSYVIIDEDYEIVEASAGTGAFLELPAGRPRANLAAMARSGLAIDIKTAVARAVATGRREMRRDLTTGTGEDRRQLSLTVEPLPQEGSRDRHFLVIFQEEPGAGEGPVARRQGSGDEDVTRALELELQTTKERLQSTLEELETSNEELRASNEELSSVNEELQSSNEELETSKEELQSINEELRTVNNELSARVDDLSHANSDLKNLFANTRIAMLFLDRGFRIRNFTPPAKPLFRLRDHDLGRPLDELAGRMDYATLKAEVRSVIENVTTVEHEVRTDGEDEPRTFIMRILPYRDAQETVTGAVLTFIDISERKRAEDRLSKMVSELNHRVKNSLASVQAMVRQARAQSGSLEDFEERVEGRVQAMATAHNILSETSWQRAELAELAHAVLSPFAEGEDRLTLKGPSIDLRPGVTVPIGLILQELATNAAKYGAWSVPGGRVSIRWEYVQGDGGSLRLFWLERGGPPAREPERPGFGLGFVRQSTDYELHGTCRPEFAPEGFECSFDLPAKEIVQRTPLPGEA